MTLLALGGQDIDVGVQSTGSAFYMRRQWHDIDLNRTRKRPPRDFPLRRSSSPPLFRTSKPITQPPHPAAHPAASSTLTSRSSTNPRNSSHHSPSTHAS